MIKARLYGTMILLFMCFHQSMAQDSSGWNVLQKMYNAYSGSISYKGEMDLYAYDDSLHPLEKIAASYDIDGSNRDFILGYIETIKTAQYYITVNRRLKTILVARSAGQSRQKGFFDLDALKKYIDSGRTGITIHHPEGQHFISISFGDQPAVKRYQISYSPSTYLIDRITIHLTDPSDPENKKKDKILNVRYFGYQARGNKSQITERKVVFVHGKKIVAGRGYEDYKIISQL